jgi:hypothetical protein
MILKKNYFVQRRPSQSLDGRGSLTRIIDDDIYDSETSPPVKVCIYT